MPCVSCLRGFHSECYTGCNSCHPSSISNSDNQENLNQPLELEYKNDQAAQSESESSTELKWQKDDVSVRDPQSTGRKRAAKLFPLDSSAPCEWQSASTDNPSGGGQFPIIEGCTGNQQARHHGPDKDTLNNSPGNVHRICHHHHVLWHHQNDESRQRPSLATLLKLKED